MQLLETALVEVAKLAGVDRCNISQAKTFLRDNGAAQIASRLSRLSKVRNGNAHPDVSLLGDISSVSVIGAGLSTLQSTVHSNESCASNGDDTISTNDDASAGTSIAEVT